MRAVRLGSVWPKQRLGEIQSVHEHLTVLTALLVVADAVEDCNDDIDGSADDYVTIIVMMVRW